jgi:hypothetical protein
MDVERFNRKKLNKGEVKEQSDYNQRQVCSYGKLKGIMGTSIQHGMLSDRTSKFQPKRVSVIVNQSIINHG